MLKGKSIFVRRIIYATPGLIVIGIIMLFIDPEYGGALLVVGGIGLIIFISMIIQSRKQKNQPLTEPQVIASLPEDNVLNTYQQPIIEQSRSVESEEIICKRCGGKNAVGTKFCTNCGGNF